MIGIRRALALLVFLVGFLTLTLGLFAQSVGTSATLQGAVTDPSGAVVPNATVEIRNPVSGFERTTQTDNSGAFAFTNVPFNPYHLTVTAPGFSPFVQDIEVRSSVPMELKVGLQVARTSATVTVEGEAGDLLEKDPIAHTDVDSHLFEKLPLESASSSVSSLITLSTPGVAADSNGLFHALGEHAENAFSVDGQPITDQQSKVFSNQIPLDSIQSLEVVSGVPPAEYGDKTTLVINVVTRSGLDLAPTGSVNLSYGSFSSENAGFNIGLGNKRIGNFLSASGLESGRFLDPPEVAVIHAKGNAENFFDRVDYQLGTNDTMHLNLGYSRSWFQQPNTFDQLATGQDQRSLIQTLNLAPSYTHLFSSTTLLSVNAFVRQDRFHYFPSADPFSDQPATLAQTRHLTNAGLRSDLSYVKGIHNVKAGTQFQHTFLSENFHLGITSPTFNAVCLNPDGSPDPNPTPTDPTQCSSIGSGFGPNPNFIPGLLRFDLTRAGALLAFNGRTDIKEIAFYAQDAITLGNWALNLGVRGDIYRGLSSDAAAEPRIGIAYNIKKTNTVLRLGHARVLVTPYNENLILSSSTGIGGLGAGGIGAFGAQPPTPARRNQFNAGFQQALGKYLVVNAEYYWKYTRPDSDFDILFSTPLTFPIQWAKSKIDGTAARISAPNFHGFTAFTVLGTTRDRFYPPERGGIIFNSPISTQVFRIDHDQAFQQTTHLQYQWKKGPWAGFSWRYDSGLVAGSVPDFAAALALDADQQATIGLFCGNLRATLASPLTPAGCAGQFPQGATLVRIPAPGTENDDRNPPRIAPRHLFDTAVGYDNIFHGDKYKWNLRVTVINLTNKVALYNFLSTFSGTHFVAPRTITGQIGFNF